VAYYVGEKVWHQGDEVTIITKPYKMYGGFFQDAKVETGKVISIATPDQVINNIQKDLANRKATQEGFRKLREMAKAGR